MPITAIGASSGPRPIALFSAAWWSFPWAWWTGSAGKRWRL